ncbi:dual 3',5'-cyclic-AMP and -GMP phosphodiesterase 11-like [Gigantopelta aegis]|uniref:dual 3',5'-cyclic-AMP and -GMP phosphodiesterase 11-like n=1 Tax=Gigantopelta aegis TaxID=1735272 RepID=UPI001B88B549|nr:dual 3',5'-cyclic-AMP and -GMP phosphodiesterase 11-like [Gigantopelta aegis]
MSSGGEGDRETESLLSPEVREEYDIMERWMDEHTEFVHDYFARKARRSMVDGWLIAHAISHSGLPIQSDSQSNSSGSNSKPSSGTNTPVRKISAQEFDKGGMLKPILSTVDGTPTFLGPVNLSASLNSQQSKLRKSKSELKALDEKELMYELVIDICNDLDVTSLCYKILLNMCILLNADRTSLFLVQGKGTNEKWLVSKLFDVGSTSSYEDIKHREQEIRIPWGTGIIGYVGKTGEVVNIPDAYQDPRFNSDIDVQMGYKTRSILSMAIKDSEGEVIGVAQAINKNSFKDEPFDEHDEKVFVSYLAFCGIGLKNAQLYEKSQMENRRNEVLLDLARIIFEEQNNLANLIYKIMMHTQSLLQCERCQVLLVDELTKMCCGSDQGLFSQVYDLQASDFDNDDTYNREGPHEPRFPINIGITGYVATTGETLNIPDVYEDDRFDPSADEGTGFRTHGILCMPIRNASGKVIGVSQLVNKLDGTSFTKNDENLFEAFSIFCGMGISNTQMYEMTVRSMAKQQVALEVLSYHAIAPMEEAQRLRKLSIPSASHFNLLDYNFSDFCLDDDGTLRATIRMFIDLDLIENFRINYETLCRWLLSVKKNYRNVTYHNWRHAFNVAQTMFCMIKVGHMGNVLTNTEILALIVGCLSHDLDHRGTNNQFQLKTSSPLAELYSTSTLEHHHFDQCIMILTTKGSDILCHVPQTDYEQILQLLEGAILATDLALYFRYRGTFFELVKKQCADWRNEDHRDLLRSMLMTASDVAAISKPWEVQKKVAMLVASEFFEQGDIEKETLKIKPVAMMDREQIDKLPSMQVDFIDGICLPVYEAIAKVSPSLSPLLHGCQVNRSNWQKVAENRDTKLEDEQIPENTEKDKNEDEVKHDNTS